MSLSALPVELKTPIIAIFGRSCRAIVLNYPSATGARYRGGPSSSLKGVVDLLPDLPLLRSITFSNVDTSHKEILQLSTKRKALMAAAAQITSWTFPANASDELIAHILALSPTSIRRLRFESYDGKYDTSSSVLSGPSRSVVDVLLACPNLEKLELGTTTRHRSQQQRIVGETWLDALAASRSSISQLTLSLDACDPSLCSFFPLLPSLRHLRLDFGASTSRDRLQNTRSPFSHPAISHMRISGLAPNNLLLLLPSFTLPTLGYLSISLASPIETPEQAVDMARVLACAAPALASIHLVPDVRTNRPDPALESLRAALSTALPAAQLFPPPAPTRREVHSALAERPRSKWMQEALDALEWGAARARKADQEGDEGMARMLFSTAAELVKLRKELER
ncbi:hypothetical protein JCM8097_004689 [Rhodosporidiobolus ruineniae]